MKHIVSTIFLSAMIVPLWPAGQAISSVVPVYQTFHEHALQQLASKAEDILLAQMVSERDHIYQALKALEPNNKLQSAAEKVLKMFRKYVQKYTDTELFSNEGAVDPYAEVIAALEDIPMFCALLNDRSKIKDYAMDKVNHMILSFNKLVEDQNLSDNMVQAVAKVEAKYGLEA